MKQHFLFTIAILTITLGCKNSSNKDGELIDGFYLKSNKEHGQKVLIEKCKDEGCFEFIQREPLISKFDLQFEFIYNQIVYADTFGVIKILPRKGKLEIWKEAKNKSKESDVYFIYKGQILSWTKIYNDAELSLCYCDYSKNEIKAIEKSLK